MQGALGAGGHAAADDLAGTAVLAGAGRFRRLAQGVLCGGVGEVTRGGESAERVGRPVQLLREPGPFPESGAGRDLGKERGEEAGGAVLAPAGGEDGLAGSGRYPSGGRGGGLGQVAGAPQLLGEPGGQRGGP